MKVQVTAVYPATDGRAPESIAVDVETPEGPSLKELASAVADIIDRLGQVAIDAHQAVQVTVAGPYDGQPRCGRLLCGHRAGVHPPNGACTACDDLDKCEGWVDPARRVSDANPLDVQRGGALR